MKTVLRVFAYLKCYPLLASGLLGCAILGTALLTVFPKITQIIIDEVIPSGNLSKLLPLVLFALLAFFARELFDALRIILNNQFEQRIIYDLRSDLYGKIQRLPLNWFDEHPSGDVMTRITEDVTQVERVLIDGIEQGLIAALQILIIGAWLFFMNPSLAAIALLPFPFLVAGSYLYSKRSQDRQRVVRKAAGEMNSLIQDNIGGIRQIKAYSIEDREKARFNAASNKLRKSVLAVMKAWATYKPSMAFLSSLGLVLILYYGGKATIQGEMGHGELTAFILYLGLFYEPVMRLHQLNQIALNGVAAGERVFEIIDSPEEPGLDEGQLLDSVKGQIEFSEVSFSYDPQDEKSIPAIQDISLKIQPGETIALVGETGAGKSTIINLLTRFYEHSGGQILLDGVPIETINKNSLRRAMGYVTQESFLFNGTVRENLLIALPKNNEENQEQADQADQALWNALEAAHATEFVRELPKGLDSLVGERGVKLSVGQKQRLSIARALLKDPPILLLDEATASVDSKTEEHIQSALNRLLEGRSSIVIAHRLSTIQSADRIYVIEGGKVVEEGQHHELLARGGAYAEFCRSSLIQESAS